MFVLTFVKSAGFRAEKNKVEDLVLMEMYSWLTFPAALRFTSEETEFLNQTSWLSVQ